MSITTIGGDLDFVLERARRLQASLGHLPTNAAVEQTTGLRGVAPADKFESALSGAAAALSTQLDKLQSYIATHAEELKAAAQRLADADASAAASTAQQAEAVQGAAVLLTAVGQAQEQVAADTTRAAEVAGVGDVDHEQRGGALK
ncbi:hypothetical protein [Cellulomonas citrea]|uniref:hypothetical protein n=1 Tax=Cellulomonas citrea TaxID=1909423 RepID=UPI00135A7838|nr:hypothetical protein [Cellulomonas citrea]